MKKRKKSTSSLIPWPVKLVGWILVAMCVLLLVVIPAVTGWYARQNMGIPSDMLATLKYVEVAQKWLLRGFVVLWVFFLGSCFASFLNVVAWRLPRGRGILGSSKCPFCNSKLTFASNMPIVGWLSSGGRCRTCKLPISPRYLWVEIALGLIFVAVVCVELFCGGVNLPTRPIDLNWGIERLVLSPKIDLIQIVAYHLILICVLFAFALVRLERKPIPYSIFIFGIIAGVGFQSLWPWTQLTSWPIPTWPMNANQSEFWLTMGMGFITGVVSGGLVWVGYRNRETSDGDILRECLFSFVLIGLFLGYQFAICLALGVLLVDSLSAVVGEIRGQLYLSSAIFKAGILTVIMLLAWRLTSQFEFWPGPESNWVELGIGIAACIFLAVLNSLIVIPRVEMAAPIEKNTDEAG